MFEAKFSAGMLREVAEAVKDVSEKGVWVFSPSELVLQSDIETTSGGGKPNFAVTFPVEHVEKYYCSAEGKAAINLNSMSHILRSLRDSDRVTIGLGKEEGQFAIIDDTRPENMTQARLPLVDFDAQGQIGSNGPEGSQTCDITISAEDFERMVKALGQIGDVKIGCGLGYKKIHKEVSFSAGGPQGKVIKVLRQSSSNLDDEHAVIIEGAELTQSFVVNDLLLSLKAKPLYYKGRVQLTMTSGNPRLKIAYDGMFNRQKFICYYLTPFDTFEGYEIQL